MYTECNSVFLFWQTLFIFFLKGSVSKVQSELFRHRTIPRLEAMAPTVWMEMAYSSIQMILYKATFSFQPALGCKAHTKACWLCQASLPIYWIGYKPMTRNINTNLQELWWSYHKIKKINKKYSTIVALTTGFGIGPTFLFWESSLCEACKVKLELMP